MTYLVIVIDLGKTNSKVALVDTDTAKEIKVLTQPAAVNTQTLYPSLDHKAIEIFILEALKALSSEYGIDAITVTTHGATVALIDAEGELALPVLDYEYQGVDELRGAYSKYRPSFSDTGSPALPAGLNIGAQLYWLQANFPDQFSSVSTILTWPQYWVFKLTGQQYNDVSSLGAHSDLYEPHQQAYSTLVSDMGWGHLLPPTQLSGKISGTLTPHIAQLTTLPSTTLVHTGIHDSNASLVPHLLAQQTPFTVVSTGTWFITMAVGGKPVALDEHRDTLLNVNAYGQSVPSARFMGGRERELLGVVNQGTEEAMHALLSEQLSPAMLMPSVVTGTGPFPNMSKHWVGNALGENDSACRDCAVALYLALMTYECMKLIGCDGPTYIEGPLARDVHFSQMLSVVSEQTVLISGSLTGTSVGAAMLIKPPVKPPKYQVITLDQTRHDQLQRYARLWQKELTDYVK